MHMSSAEIITREELYELVWREPITVLTRKNEFSEYAIRKACKSMKIPTPKAGYWVNIRLGKKINRLALRHDPSALAYINLSSIRKSRSIAENYQEGNFTVTSNELDIRVSAAVMGRATRWMNFLLQTIKARNHAVSIENGNTYARVYGQSIRIYLRELTKTSGPKSKWTNAPPIATGLLAFKIDGYPGREWRDGNLSLEEQFLHIIEGLEQSAREQQEEALRVEKAKLVANEIENNAHLKRNLAEQELNNFKLLLEDAERWQKAQTLKAYIAHWKATVIATHEMSVETAEKIQWAEQKANWYDPHSDYQDELFSNIDKNTLEFRSGKSFLHAG